MSAVTAVAGEDLYSLIIAVWSSCNYDLYSV